MCAIHLHNLIIIPHAEKSDEEPDHRKGKRDNFPGPSLAKRAHKDKKKKPAFSEK